jgi:hypothetical protein
VVERYLPPSRQHRPGSCSHPNHKHRLCKISMFRVSLYGYRKYDAMRSLGLQLKAPLETIPFLETVARANPAVERPAMRAVEKRIVDRLNVVKGERKMS